LTISLLPLLLLLQAVDLPLKVSQTAAILEVVHAMIGLVKSPVAITGWLLHSSVVVVVCGARVPALLVQLL
jgi:hypothetical protein